MTENTAVARSPFTGPEDAGYLRSGFWQADLVKAALYAVTSEGRTDLRGMTLTFVVSEDGATVTATLTEPHPCGHRSRVTGCGGCDPGAIEFVIEDGGQVRPFDPDRDMRHPDERAPS